MRSTETSFRNSGVVHRVGRVDARLSPKGWAHARDAERVGARPVLFFQVVGVLQHGEALEAVVVQPEEDPQPHVVQAPSHGPIHGQEAVIVVALGAADVLHTAHTARHQDTRSRHVLGAVLNLTKRLSPYSTHETCLSESRP